MEFINAYLLNLIIGLPLLGFIILAIIPKERHETLKRVTFIFSVATFILSLPLFVFFDGTNPDPQFVYQAVWWESWGSYYHVAVDGISLLLVMLTTVLFPLVVWFSRQVPYDRVKGFMMALLFQQFGTLGVFCVRDMLWFYIFWEAMLIPMYFLIGIWGHEDRIRATVKFFIYTLSGSLLMLVAIIYGYLQTAPVMADGKILAAHSFSFDAFMQASMPLSAQSWMFLAFALAFAIKSAVFPFHGWLPSAYTEAPMPGTIILSAILAKTGIYGFLQICIPFYPIAADYFGSWLLILSVTGVIFGALVAMVQKDFKRLLAYASISHLGFIVLGVFAFTVSSWQGVVIQMVNHGLVLAMLFILLGYLNRRRAERDIGEYGGLWSITPKLAALFLVATLAMIGLPGLNGFIGEFLILIGAFSESAMVGASWYAAAAVLSIILCAVYMLRLYQSLMFGKSRHEANSLLADLIPREWWVTIPIMLFIFWIGIYPGTFLSKTEATVSRYLHRHRAAVYEYEIKTFKKSKYSPVLPEPNDIHAH